MPQATKIGRHVFQIDDAGLANAIDNELEKQDSLVAEISDLKARLDAADSAQTKLDAELTEAQASLATASAAKVQAEAEIAALQTKLDASNEQLKKANSKKPDEDIEEELDDEGKPKKGKGKPKFDSDEVKSYCKEFLSVVSEVTPALKKVDSAFEPDFGLSPLDYKAQYLKTLTTLPTDAKARIDSSGDERDMFVEHLYMALKPVVAEAPTKADEGSQQLAAAIEQNRGLTLDAGEKKGSFQPKEDSPTMKARKERKLPSAYSSK
jgi:regulator of replication initiation timing